LERGKECRKELSLAQGGRNGGEQLAGQTGKGGEREGGELGETRNLLTGGGNAYFFWVGGGLFHP